jgi:hypothetical protein
MSLSGLLGVVKKTGAAASRAHALLVVAVAVAARFDLG